MKSTSATSFYANTIHSPSSLIKPDDLEAYRRVQDGLHASGSEWISQHSQSGPEHGRWLAAVRAERAVHP